MKLERKSKLQVLGCTHESRQGRINRGQYARRIIRHLVLGGDIDDF